MKKKRNLLIVEERLRVPLLALVSRRACRSSCSTGSRYHLDPRGKKENSCVCDTWTLSLLCFIQPCRDGKCKICETRIEPEVESTLVNPLSIVKFKRLLMRSIQNLFHVAITVASDK